MDENAIHPENPFYVVPHTPVLQRVSYPVIEIKDRLIRVSLEDVQGNPIQLEFQPYQAMRLTTQDCFLAQPGSERLHSRILYQKTSPWLAELKAALKVIDRTADFMDQALHFTIPAGDDVLEIAAWKVAIAHLDAAHLFPKNVKMPF